MAVGHCCSSEVRVRPHDRKTEGVRLRVIEGLEVVRELLAATLREVHYRAVIVSVKELNLSISNDIPLIEPGEGAKCV